MGAVGVLGQDLGHPGLAACLIDVVQTVACVSRSGTLFSVNFDEDPLGGPCKIGSNHCLEQSIITL
jgi:hypothetical protein